LAAHELIRESMMARIAVGGFQHETNTFAPSPATYADFEAADAWPGLVQGAALLDSFAGLNVPIAGFIEEARALGHDLVPLAWCSAIPSAHVSEDAFERIAALLTAALAAGAPYDAVYLDLHGAMVCEHLEDGEGELLRRVRRVVGERLPLMVSLDLHANVSRAMVERATALVAYRTYPHVDMAETGARAAHHLDRLLRRAKAEAKALVKLPFLIPLTWQCTTEEPARSLYAALETLEGDGVTLSFAPGFPPADIAECGPAVLAYGASQEAAARAAAELAAAVRAAEGDFAGRLYEADEAVEYALRRAGDRPIVLADTQDNPGAGANGDTVGLLEALLRHDAREALLGVICDAATAAQAHAAGEGREIEIVLGATSGLVGHSPFRGRARVERLSDGRCTGSGPFYGGSRIRLGPSALLAIGGVRVAVSSRKLQAADQAMFQHLGAEPRAHRIVALKSSVHFRAHFQPIAAEVLVVTSPGPNPADHTRLDYRRLRPGVRLMPLGQESGRREPVS